MMRYQNLYDILTAREPSAFRGFGDFQNTDRGTLIFQDHGAKILGVGHLDYVMYSKPRLKRNIVRCPQLDDRLGVWLLLDILQKYANFDVLLTDQEERCNSSAALFQPPRQYNWMFEFDRMGANEIALYQYYNQESVDLVYDFGFKPVYGSYTDICELDFLGCLGFNFPVGYHYQHSRYCYADLVDTKQSVRQFLNFFDIMQEVELTGVMQ